jgi:preprotein translocase subunit SecG
MATVILVIHLLIAMALVAVVLLQRSEGGGLGMGSGGGGGFMTGRGQSNLLTRTTAVLAAGFFTTSILLSILANSATQPRSILDGLDKSVPAKSGSAPVVPGAPVTPSAPATPGGASAPATPAAPTVPAAPAPPKSQ